MTSRTCHVCGNSLDGHRRDARLCSPRCRAHYSRLKRLLRDGNADGYTNLDEYLSARRKRTGAAS